MTDQPGTFKCTHAQCKSCPFIHNVEKIWGPKRSTEIADRFTYTSANVIYCITRTQQRYSLAKQEESQKTDFQNTFVK